MDFALLTVWANELFPRYLSESNFKLTSRKTFQAGFKCFIKWCRENGISVPNTASLIQWRAFLLANYQMATAQTYLSSVKGFCRWFALQEYGKDIGAQVKSIRPLQGSRRGNLSEVEIKRVLAHLEDNVKEIQTGNKQEKNHLNSEAEKRTNTQYAISLRDYVMVLVMLVCGLRVSEVSLLDIGDLSTVNGTPVIWVKGKGRDGKAEYVTVPPNLQQILFKYFETREGITRKSPMFVSYAKNSFNKRLSSRSVSRIAKEAMVAVGLKLRRLTAHSYRHTAVTMAITAGASVLQVQQFARHRLFQTTLRYIHMIEATANPCSSLIIRLIGRLDVPGNLFT